MSRMSSSRPSPRATHPALHIRTAHDAHVVFEAVRLGLLPMIRRRLSPTERDLLHSGEVFVWEEAEYKGGLERWTDGRKWSQSRMREPFLFYEEKAMPTTDEKAAKAARRRKDSDCDPSSPKPANSTRRQERPSKQGGFTKQTYSAFVSLPGSNTRKKWHLTAYFIDHTELPVIDQDQLLSRVQVPQGIYQTGKGLIRKSDRLLRDDEDYSESERCTPSYHVPSPRNLSISTSFGSMPTDEGSHSPWSASSASSLPLTPPAHPSTLPLPAYYAASSGGYSPARMPSLPMPDSSCLPPSIPLALPSIRNSPYLSPHLQSFQPLEPSEPFDAKSQSRYTYTPRSHEDQRAVGAFRIAL